MIKSRRAGSCDYISHAIIILLLLLIGVFIAWVFLYKVEKFQGSKVAVKYYFLPGCTYCNQFNPEWEKFATMSGNLATVEKIDGSAGSIPSYVKGFPYVEFIVDGKAEEYKGDRTANALMDKLRSLQ